MRPKSPTPDPHAFSAYLENLLASLDQPQAPLDLSAHSLSTNEIYEAVHQPLIGFQESGLDTHDFLTSLNKEQLDDLAPRLTRAVSVVQGVAPSSLMRPTQEMVNRGSFGISPAMLEAQPVASTSARPYRPDGHITNGHTANDFDYAANDFYDGTDRTNGWENHVNGDTHQQEDGSDEEDEDEDDTMHQMREETIPADVLDRELALAMHSPTVSPPPDPPDPPTNGFGEHDAADLDSFFDIYQIFATYEEAENAILSNGRTEKMPLNIRWRPNPYARTNLKGACYECVRQCGYEIKLSDDAMEKWRVTSIEGQHEAQCYPSYRGKKTARSSRNRIPTKPSQAPVSFLRLQSDRVDEVLMSSASDQQSKSKQEQEEFLQSFITHIFTSKRSTIQVSFFIALDLGSRTLGRLSQDDKSRRSCHNRCKRYSRYSYSRFFAQESHSR